MNTEQGEENNQLICGLATIGITRSAETSWPHLFWICEPWEFVEFVESYREQIQDKFDAESLIIFRKGVRMILEMIRLLKLMYICYTYVTITLNTKKKYIYIIP